VLKSYLAGKRLRVHCSILSFLCGCDCALSGYPPDHFDLNIRSLLSLTTLRSAATVDGIVMPAPYTLLNHIALLFSTSNSMLYISYP